MAKKKTTKTEVDTDVEDYNILDEGEESFYSDGTAYLPVFNKERSAYDMFIIRVNTKTKEVEIEVEQCTYDSVHRATFDLNQRYAKDSVGGRK